MRLQEHIDFTTLQWVKPELDGTLSIAREALESYVENPTKRDFMRTCTDRLHQVHGTLRMVELYGAAMVAAEMEMLSVALTEEHVTYREEGYAVLMRGLMQLPDYLERLASGHRDVPVVLLPLLNDLRASREQAPLPESALFHPNLNATLPEQAPGAVDEAFARAHREELAGLRLHFQQALLGWFRGQDPERQLAHMRKTLLAIAARCYHVHGRRLWWIGAGVLEGLEQGMLRSQAGTVRQLIGKVDRSIRELIESGENGLRSSAADEVACELLYIVAQAKQRSPQMELLRSTYALDSLLPDANELEHARGSMAGHNRALLDSVSRALKDDLLRVKEALDLFLRQQNADPTQLSAQSEILERVGDTLGMLALAVPRRVVNEQRRVLNEICDRMREPDEETLLDVAGALLYVEASLDDHIESLGSEDEPATGESGQGLPRSEVLSIVSTLMQETISNTGKVKEAIVAFVESGWEHDRLAEVPNLMSEVAGAVRMLSAARPAELAEGIGRFVADELLADHRVPSGAQMDYLADALAALEYYLEAAREHRGGLEHILDVAEQSLSQLGYWPLPAARAMPEVAVATSEPSISTVAAPLSVMESEQHPELSESVSLAAGNDATQLFIGEREPLLEPTQNFDGLRLVQTEATTPPQPENTMLDADDGDWVEIEEEVFEQEPVRDTLAANTHFNVDAEGIDDDIREIFLEEVQEEIDNLRGAQDEWLAEPTQISRLTSIRRSFHTLKGSGRLVGASVLGEFAWKVENLLNRVLDSTIEPDANVQALLSHAIGALPQLLTALKDQGEPSAPLSAIMHVADELSAGRPAQIESYAPARTEMVRKVVRRRVPRFVAAADAVPQASLTDASAATAEQAEGDPTLSFTLPVMPIVDPVLLEILRSEVAQYLQTIRAAIQHSGTELTLDEGLLRAVHTLHGAIAMVDIPVLVQLLSPLEGLCKRLRGNNTPMSPAGIQLLVQAADVVDHVMHQFDVAAPQLPNVDGLVDQLIAMRDQYPESRIAHVLYEPHADDFDATAGTSADADAANVAADLAADATLVTFDGGAEEDATSALSLSTDELQAPELSVPSEPSVAPTAGLEDDSRGLDDALSAELLAGLNALDTEQDVAGQRAVASAEAEARQRAADEQIAAERALTERAEAAQREADEAAAEAHAAEQLAAEAAAKQAETERLQAERSAAEQIAAEQAAADHAAAEQAAEQAAAEQVEADRLVAEQVEVERAAAAQAVEQAATEAAASERAAAEQAAAEQAAAEQAAAEQADAARAQKDASATAAAALAAADYVTDQSVGTETSDAAFAFGGAGPIDADLMEVFVDEAHELLDHADSVLAQWRTDPTDLAPVAELRRDLHTLKGGARIAGLTQVGDLAHATETLLEKPINDTAKVAPMVAALEASFDQLFTLVERVSKGESAAYPQAMIDRLLALAGEQNFADEAALAALAGPMPGTVPAAAPVVAPLPSLPSSVSELDLPALLPESTEDTQQPQEQIRVRAELLDNLVSHAGEVAIYRSRLEQQVAGYRFNLVELEQTVARLRSQLRMLEIETEAQIIARFQREHREAGLTTFDPLELDRYSQLQQYSRALAESVSDLVSIQTTLDELTRQAETLLIQQSRVSTELQDGLLRTRMLPFDTMVPNLRRTLRQAAKEEGKSAQLFVDGAHGEMDRNLLDRMKAPFEHMLRNSIAHGIETPAERRKAGKPVEGAVHIRVAREATEVVIRFSDDGRGLDREAIRQRGIQRGLLQAGAKTTDYQLLSLITQPGFSTASNITQLAGRGVGMDVVANEIKQLGGSLSIESEHGHGTTFVMRLPFTLAVTQAIMVRIGEATFAIPMTSVQGVARVDPDELAERMLDDEPAFQYGGEEYDIHDLADLLGLPPGVPVEGEQQPLLLTRAGDLRAAIRLDAVLGSREIVVKSVGPQISSVPGLLGATIMGDGSVLVILDLAPLVRHGITRRQQRLAEGLSAVQAPVIEEVQIRPLVMVVDDSITMRKVTSRVLERHEYEVSTAKDGVDAVEKLHERVPDLMLLDIEMPRMDGYELATLMKADPRLRDVPIIMITSRSGDKHRQRAFDIGVDRYLGKPYQEAELLLQIGEVLDARMQEPSHD
ncbi:MAG: Hpt domain-containing protein [Rhodanobacter sp.]